MKQSRSNGDPPHGPHADAAPRPAAQWLPAWQAFVKALEAGSMAAAARQLGCTRAKISKQVAELEAAFGTRLLERSTRRLRLTPAGELFHHHALAALDAVAATQIAVRNQGDTPQGVLRVGAPMTFGRMYIAPLMRRLMQQHPGLVGELVLSDELVDLESDDIDLVLRMTRTPPQDAVVRRLAAMDRIICAAPAYLAAHGTPAQAGDLAQHETLSYLLTDDNRWHVRGPNGDEHILRATSRLRTNSVDCMLDAVLDGQGLAIVPLYLAAPYLAAGRLVQVLPGHDPSTRFGRHLYACYTPSRVRAAKVRVLLQALQDLFDPLPPWAMAGASLARPMTNDE